MIWTQEERNFEVKYNDTYGRKTKKKAAKSSEKVKIGENTRCDFIFRFFGGPPLGTTAYWVDPGFFGLTKRCVHFSHMNDADPTSES